MELKKTVTNIDQIENAEGQTETRVNNVQYNLNDAAGQTIGHATVYPTYISIQIGEVYGVNTIEEGTEKLKAIFGITE